MCMLVLIVNMFELINEVIFVFLVIGVFGFILFFVIWFRFICNDLVFCDVGELVINNVVLVKL